MTWVYSNGQDSGLFTVLAANLTIVVDGDAERFVGLAARGGETQNDYDGSLQEGNVSDRMRNVVQWAREAFDRRWRLIAMEARRT